MGERHSSDLRGHFDARLRLEFHRAQVRSHAGLLAFRELDEALGLSPLAARSQANNREIFTPRKETPVDMGNLGLYLHRSSAGRIRKSKC